MNGSKRRTLAFPVPPLELGVVWTGRSLLNYVVEKADNDMKAALISARDTMGGEAFRALFERNAAALNRRAGPQAFFCSTCGKVIGAPGQCVGCVQDGKVIATPTDTN